MAKIFPISMLGKLTARLKFCLKLVVYSCFFIIPCCLTSSKASAQDNNMDNGSGEYLTIDDCINYAMRHQPLINEAQINIAIARTTNAINLSGWLPQANLSGNLIHYNQLPTTFIAADSTGGRPIATHSGIVNTFIPELSISQTIFNPQLLFAAKSARLYVKEARLARDSTRIFLYSAVSKAFYNLLLTLEQINVLKEDTARLNRNVMDTYHQFVGGIVDETDYDEAVISLNNSKAQLKQQVENVVPQYATLKQLMGYPPRKEFNVSFDTAQMIQEIGIDTTEALQFKKRIEYQQIRVARELQNKLIGYYDLAFLPTISAFYNYFDEYESPEFSNLFDRSYPYSYFGLTFNLPIFTGFSRLENVRRAKLQRDIIDWQEYALKSEIYTEYTTALANYKSNLYNWSILKENVDKAKNVYRIVSLQYKQGIVAYLNMIVAESNLISAEIGYTNALFQLLQSKIDLQKAMGNIPYDSQY